jgi:two-component system chemotaxis sensor kinase CheA
MQLEKGQAPCPLIVLFGTILKPEDINVLFEIPDHRIHQVMADMTVHCIGSESPDPVQADDPPEPAMVAVNRTRCPSTKLNR